MLVTHLSSYNRFKKTLTNQYYMPRKSTNIPYVNLRVPKTEYDKLKQVRDQLKKIQEYSWVKNLALGALIGLLAGLVMNEITRQGISN